MQRTFSRVHNAVEPLGTKMYLARRRASAVSSTAIRTEGEEGVCEILKTKKYLVQSSVRGEFGMEGARQYSLASDQHNRFVVFR